MLRNNNLIFFSKRTIIRKSEKTKLGFIIKSDKNSNKTSSQQILNYLDSVRCF